MFQTDRIGDRDYIHVGYSARCLSISCTSENKKSIISCLHLGPFFGFKYHYRKVRVLDPISPFSLLCNILKENFAP